MAGRYDIDLDQGATFTRQITWKTGTPAAAVNITGYSARMDVKSMTGALLMTLSTDNGRISLGGAAGTVTLTISATHTNTMMHGIHVYDLEMTSGGGVVTRLLEGELRVRRQITLAPQTHEKTGAASAAAVAKGVAVKL